MHTGTVLPETQKWHQRGQQGIAAGRRDHSRGCGGSHLEASQAQGMGSMLAHELPVSHRGFLLLVLWSNTKHPFHRLHSLLECSV